MPATQPHERSPLARLVLFMVCLSIAATLGAWVYSAAIEVPGPVTIAAPENRLDNSGGHSYCVFAIKETGRLIALQVDSEITKASALRCFDTLGEAVARINVDP